MFRWRGVILVLILALLGLATLLGTRYGLRVGPHVFAIDQDKKILEEKTLSFIEDLQFKDFDTAATYHHPDDRERVNIPRLIERLFGIKPELLDFREFHVTSIDFDHTGDRARVFTRTKIKVLNTAQIKEPEVIFYYKRRDGQWWMELESSLR